MIFQIIVVSKDIKINNYLPNVVHERRYLVYKLLFLLKYCKLVAIDENEYSQVDFRYVR